VIYTKYYNFNFFILAQLFILIIISNCISVEPILIL